MVHAHARSVDTDPVLTQITSLFDPLDTPFGVVDAAGRFSHANPAFLNLLPELGWTAGTPLLQDLVELPRVVAALLFQDSGALDFKTLPFKGPCRLRRREITQDDDPPESLYEPHIQLEPHHDPMGHQPPVVLCTIRSSSADETSLTSSLCPPKPTAKNPLNLWRSRVEEIGDSFDMERIGAKTCKALLDLTDAHAAAFYRLEQSTDPKAEGQSWHRVEQIGQMQYLERTPVEFSCDSPWLRPAMSLSIVEFKSLRAQKTASPLPDWVAKGGAGAIMVCQAHGDNLGLAFLWGDEKNRRSPATRDLLGLISFQAAQAVEHARWFQFARQSDSRSQQLIDDANAIILGLDLSGKVTLWNQKASDVFGYGSEETLGRSISDVLDAYSDEAENGRQHFETAIKSQQPLNDFELAMRDKNDQRRHIVWSTSLFFSPNGSPLGLYAIGQDITHRKDLECKLTTSEKKYRNLVETTHDLYWIIRLDVPEETFSSETPSIFKKASLSFLNRAFAGLDRDALMGRNIERIKESFSTESLRHFEKACRQVLLEEKPVQHLETEHKKPDSTEIDIYLLSDLFPYYEDDRLVGLQILSIDVTDRKEIEAQMLQAQKLESVGTLARGISHDFNNILNGVGGFLYLIEKSTDEPEKVLKHCGRIKKLTSRAARLTRQMQTYARQGKTEKRSIDLNEIIRQTLDIFQASLSNNKLIEVETDLSDNLEWIEADFSQIEQVIMNLCMNAAEAMPKGGTLSLRTRPVTLASPDAAPGSPREINYSVLEVRDTGAGMPPQVKARIFDPFFTTKKTGNGLGLSAVYGVLKAHRALTRVDSQIDVGTCFTLHFPASDRKKNLLGDDKKSSKIQGGHETILVVDDEEPVRMVSEDILKTLGYRVILAADGEEAVQIFQERPQSIDLVLTDIDMPNLNGRAAAKIMRLVRPDLKVMFVSGYNDSLQFESLNADGFHRFLSKPYTMFELQDAVRTALDSNDSIR